MHCHLLIPDLLPRSAITEQNDPLHRISAPALQALLARSSRERSSTENMESWLCEAFGVDSGLDYPVASLCALAQGIETGNSYWLRADPVHLAVERDQLVLEQGPVNSLSKDESLALVATLNQHFACDGLHFLTPHPKHWYLRLDQPAAIATQTLHRALGQNIHPLLPTGPDALRWRALLNEIQMLLFSHPVNEAREARGDLPVNSTWLWGGGAQPNHLRSPFDEIWANEPLPHGLAEKAGIPHRMLPDGVDDWLEEIASGSHLLVLDSLRDPASYGDPHSWREQLLRLEELWFAPLKRAAQRGKIDLTLHVPTVGGTSSFTTNRSRLWKFWKPIRQLKSYRLPE